MPAFIIIPSDLVIKAIPANGEVSVHWSDGATAGGKVLGHQPYINGVAQPVYYGKSPYVIRGLTNGTSYSFSLLTIHEFGPSEMSPIVSATPQLAQVYPPTIEFLDFLVGAYEGTLTDTPITRTIRVLRNGTVGALTINLAYSGTATSGVDYTGGVASVAVPAGADTVSFVLTILGDTASETQEVLYIDATLGASTTRSIVVIANDDGQSAPAAPTIGTLVAGNNEITVPWTDGNDGGSPITRHRLWLNGEDAGIFASGSPYVLSGTVNGTQMSIALSAINDAGFEGPKSVAKSLASVGFSWILQSGSWNDEAPWDDSQLWKDAA